MDWLLDEVALLLIGLTEISLTKFGFYHPSVNRIASQVATSDLRWSHFILSHSPLCLANTDI
jgi:hypothetical protein